MRSFFKQLLIWGVERGYNADWLLGVSLDCFWRKGDRHDREGAQSVGG